MSTRAQRTAAASGDSTGGPGAKSRSKTVEATAPAEAVDGQRRFWPEESLNQLLAAACAQRADDLAVVDVATRLTHAELAAEVDRVAGGLANLGVQAGSVVTAVLPTCWEMQALPHSVWRLGAIHNPASATYREHELAFILRDATPSAVVIPHRYHGFDYVEMVAAMRQSGQLELDVPVIVVRPLAPLPSAFLGWEQLQGAPEPSITHTSASDIALLLYTSGTTGVPKGVLHTHGTLMYEVDSVIEIARLDADDHVFMPSPLTHITGLLYGTILPVRRRIPCTLAGRWNAGLAVDLIEQEKCTFSVAATPFLRGLATVYEHRGKRSSLRVFICGGANIPSQLVLSSRGRMGTRVVRAYGSTEMPTFSCGDPFGDERQAAETDGVAIGPSEAKLLAPRGGVGELAVRGPELFVGYLDADVSASAFTSDGFFRTGDTAFLDADGSVVLRGRLTDIIVRGGENISAAEVENLLSEHPAVEEVAVVGAPDPMLGERPWAFVCTVSSAGFTLADAQDHLRRRGLARQKWPVGIDVLRRLPKTPSGKVKKYVLRARLRREG